MEVTNQNDPMPKDVQDFFSSTLRFKGIKDASLRQSVISEVVDKAKELVPANNWAFESGSFRKVETSKGKEKADITFDMGNKGQLSIPGGVPRRAVVLTTDRVGFISKVSFDNSGREKSPASIDGNPSLREMVVMAWALLHNANLPASDMSVVDVKFLRHDKEFGDHPVDSRIGQDDSVVGMLKEKIAGFVWERDANGR